MGNGVEFIDNEDGRLISYFCWKSGTEKHYVSPNVKIIAINTYAECNGLEEVVLHGGIEKISLDAFSHCPSLNSIIIPNGVKSMSGNLILSRAGNLAHLTLPPSLWDGGNISSYVFRGSSITSLCFDTTDARGSCVELAKNTTFWGKEGITATCGGCKEQSPVL